MYSWRSLLGGSPAASPSSCLHPFCRSRPSLPMRARLGLACSLGKSAKRALAQFEAKLLLRHAPPRGNDASRSLPCHTTCVKNPQNRRSGHSSRVFVQRHHHVKKSATRAARVTLLPRNDISRTTTSEHQKHKAQQHHHRPARLRHHNNNALGVEQARVEKQIEGEKARQFKITDESRSTEGTGVAHVKAVGSH